MVRRTAKKHAGEKKREGEYLSLALGDRQKRAALPVHLHLIRARLRVRAVEYVELGDRAAGLQPAVALDLRAADGDRLAEARHHGRDFT